jgi:DNA-binding CsgD family transcriptional regulator
VNKQLERIFEKMGVETRTAAAAQAMEKMRAKFPY